MKWDLTTISSLYLVAISQDRTIKSLRDLRKRHVPLLQGIRDEANRIVREKYGLRSGSLRMFIHYQPSYCMPSFYRSIRCLITSPDHFHVHIVNANYIGSMGMAVGQAHLLDDVISLVSLLALMAGVRLIFLIPARAGTRPGTRDLRAHDTDICAW